MGRAVRDKPWPGRWHPCAPARCPHRSAHRAWRRSAVHPQPPERDRGINPRRAIVLLHVDDEHVVLARPPGVLCGQPQVTVEVVAWIGAVQELLQIADAVVVIICRSVRVGHGVQVMEHFPAVRHAIAIRVELRGIGVSLALLQKVEAVAVAIPGQFFTRSGDERIKPMHDFPAIGQPVAIRVALERIGKRRRQFLGIGQAVAVKIRVIRIDGSLIDPTHPPEIGHRRAGEPIAHHCVFTRFHQIQIRPSRQVGGMLEKIGVPALAPPRQQV